MINFTFSGLKGMKYVKYHPLWLVHNGCSVNVRSLPYSESVLITWRFFTGKAVRLLSIRFGTSLVAQWLRIHLPMQGTRVRALVQEDPTCCGATKPVHHNYWAWALGPTNCKYWARVPQLLKPVRLKPVLCNRRSHRDEKPVHRNEE